MISVLSLNCWVHFYDKECPKGNRLARMEEIGTWILEQEPDVIALQECNLLGMPLCAPLGTECLETFRIRLCRAGYTCYHEQPKHAFFQNSGLFFATKFKFLESKTIPFTLRKESRLSRRLATKVNGKGFQYVLLEIDPEHRVQVVNVHNDAFLQKDREAEHKQIQAYLEMQEPSYPSIILGDLNSSSKEELESVKLIYGLPHTSCGTKPTHEDGKCYDQCLSTYAIEKEEIISEAKLSDHFPILYTLRYLDPPPLQLDHPQL